MGLIKFVEDLNRYEQTEMARIVADILREDLEILENLQKDQLYAGQNSNGERLSPSYSSDPFFKKPGAGARYAAYKDKLNQRTPNSIFAKKDSDTPNLIVTGTLVYNTIFTTVNTNKSLIIDAASPILSQLNAKYKEPFGLNQTSWTWYAENHLLPKLKKRTDEFFKQ